MRAKAMDPHKSLKEVYQEKLKTEPVRTRRKKMSEESQECNNRLWVVVNVGKLIWRGWRLSKRAEGNQNPSNSSPVPVWAGVAGTLNPFFFQIMYIHILPYAYTKCFQKNAKNNAEPQIQEYFGTKRVWMKILWDQREKQLRPPMWTMSLWKRIMTALKAKPRRGMDTQEWWGLKINVHNYLIITWAEQICSMQRLQCFKVFILVVMKGFDILSCDPYPSK